jgi:abortive infection bacteriophage resistance protein
MSKKVFRSLDEQVDILKSKGLVIQDEEKTKEILFRENYFFISGYRHLFMKSFKDREFISGTTFEELYSVFLFDRKIRNIMFQYILIIENNIKSIISYQLSKKYGIREKDYLNPENFTQDNLKQRQVHDILNKMKRQIRVNGRQHTATMHYLDNYGYVPLWILVKVLSFGILSELYNILKSEDAQAIAQIYHTDIETMSAYLTILANFRNLCAHEDILYDHRTQKEIPDTEYHRILNIEMTDGHYNYGKNDLFAVMIIMKRMLSEEEFKDFFFQIGYEIDILENKVKVVKTTSILNKIGFPNNWRDLDDID